MTILNTRWFETEVNGITFKFKEFVETKTGVVTDVHLFQQLEDGGLLFVEALNIVQGETNVR